MLDVLNHKCICRRHDLTSRTLQQLAKGSARASAVDPFFFLSALFGLGRTTISLIICTTNCIRQKTKKKDDLHTQIKI